MGCYVPGRGFGPCSTCDDEEVDDGFDTFDDTDYEVGLAW